MTQTTTITVPAARYEDHDDCLSAAAADVAEEYGLEGWDLEPRWADDEREQIVLTVPAGVAGVARISTTKGTHTGTLLECLEWQAEYQGACASVTVDGVEVDISDLAIAHDDDQARQADDLTPEQAERVVLHRVAESRAMDEGVVAGDPCHECGAQVLHVDGCSEIG